MEMAVSKSRHCEPDITWFYGRQSIMKKNQIQTQIQPAYVVPAPHFAKFEGSHVAGPTHDEIASRAYDLYVMSGCRQGQCKQNWRQAEESFLEYGETGGEAVPGGAIAAAR